MLTLVMNAAQAFCEDRTGVDGDARRARMLGIQVRVTTQPPFIDGLDGKAAGRGVWLGEAALLQFRAISIEVLSRQAEPLSNERLRYVPLSGYAWRTTHTSTIDRRPAKAKNVKARRRGVPDGRRGIQIACKPARGPTAGGVTERDKTLRFSVRGLSRGLARRSRCLKALARRP